jgi:peptidoglycan/LPS O-acetylase OafA/YrhL
MNEKYYYLDVLRVIGCIAVVCIHTSGYQKDLLLNSNYYLLISVLQSPGVALFFFIAGVLSCIKANNRITFTKYIAKKASRLLVPYLFVSFFIGLLISIVHSLNIIHIQQNPSLIHNLTTGILLTTTVPHLYFLISLFLIYSMFPICWPILQKPIKSLLFTIFYTAIGFKIIEFGYSFSPLQLPESPGIPHSTIRGLVYFLTGVSFGHFSSYLIPSIKKYGYIFSIICFCVAFIAKVNTIFIYNSIPLCSYSMLYAFVSLSIYLPDSLAKIIGGKAGLTYGIYLFHMPIFINLINRTARLIIDNAIILNMVSVLLVLILTSLFVLLLKRNNILARLFIGE